MIIMIKIQIKAKQNFRAFNAIKLAALTGYLQWFLFYSWGQNSLSHATPSVKLI